MHMQKINSYQTIQVLLQCLCLCCNRTKCVPISIINAQRFYHSLINEFKKYERLNHLKSQKQLVNTCYSNRDALNQRFKY
jgi:hypothetical protein